MLASVALTVLILAWFILTFEDFVDFLAKRVAKRMEEDKSLATPEPST